LVYFESETLKKFKNKMLKSKNKTSKPKAEEEYFSNRADQSDSDNNQAKDSKLLKRLCGTRGLDCLLEIFDKFKSKGSNHEVFIR